MDQNFNGNQDRPMIRSQDLRNRPIGYVTDDGDGQISRSSSNINTDPILASANNPEYLLSNSFSNLSLSSPSPSPSVSALASTSQYLQQRPHYSAYFDGGSSTSTTSGLLNNGDQFFGQEMNYPVPAPGHHEFMFDPADFNISYNPFLERDRWGFPIGDQRTNNPYVMNPMRAAETQWNNAHQGLHPLRSAAHMDLHSIRTAKTQWNAHHDHYPMGTAETQWNGHHDHYPMGTAETQWNNIPHQDLHPLGLMGAAETRWNNNNNPHQDLHHHHHPMRAAETQWNNNNNNNPHQDFHGMNPMSMMRQRGNQGNRFYRNDSSFLNNKKHSSGIPPVPKSSCSSIGKSPRIPCVYDFNLSDTGLGHGVLQTVKPHHHPRQMREHNLPLRELRGEIMLYAKDQSLCRILQDKFESPNQEDVDMVVSEIILHLQDLMTDQYGNYLFQKLIKVCNEDQKNRIVWTLCNPAVQLLAICQNLHGSRSVQKLLECVNKAEQISMITSSLVPGTLNLAIDPHGHHVLQQCFKLFSSDDNQNLIKAMAENCFQIATNKSGCVVLHACVSECQGQAKGFLLKEIIANTLHLAEDPYGNYVVQHVLELRIPAVNESILKQLEGNFFSFSRSKFASNVVEKCLSETEPGQAEGVIVELITNHNISMLLVDPFGNFVVQSAFIASKGRVQEQFLEVIRLSMSTLRSNLYGKKIIQMLEKKKIRLI